MRKRTKAVLATALVLSVGACASHETGEAQPTESAAQEVRIDPRAKKTATTVIRMATTTKPPKKTANTTSSRPATTTTLATTTTTEAVFAAAATTVPAEPVIVVELPLTKAAVQQGFIDAEQAVVAGEVDRILRFSLVTGNCVADVKITETEGEVGIEARPIKATSHEFQNVEDVKMPVTNEKKTASAHFDEVSVPIPIPPDQAGKEAAALLLVGLIGEECQNFQNYILPGIRGATPDTDEIGP